MRAIAPSMPPHAFTRQGRRRPTPRFCAASEVIDFALVAVSGMNNGSVGRVAGRRGAMRAIAPSMPRTGHRATRAGKRAARSEVQKHKQTTANKCPANGPSSSAFNFRVAAFNFRVEKAVKSHRSPRSQIAQFYVQPSSGFCWISSVVRRLFEVNSEPHTGARPSVRLCVGLIKPRPLRRAWGGGGGAVQGRQDRTGGYCSQTSTSDY
jgi:hypothetical protein